MFDHKKYASSREMSYCAKFGRSGLNGVGNGNAETVGACGPVCVLSFNVTQGK